MASAIKMVGREKAQTDKFFGIHSNCLSTQSVTGSESSKPIRPLSTAHQSKDFTTLVGLLTAEAPETVAGTVGSELLAADMRTSSRAA